MNLHKIKVYSKDPEQVSTGRNTKIELDGKPLLGVTAFNAMFNAKETTRVMIDMLVNEVDIDGVLVEPEITKDELIEVRVWDPNGGVERLEIINLQDIIKNPSGIKLDLVGLALLNKERKKLGLKLYKRNYATGTYDEET